MVAVVGLSLLLVTAAILVLQYKHNKHIIFTWSH